VSEGKVIRLVKGKLTLTYVIVFTEMISAPTRGVFYLTVTDEGSASTWAKFESLCGVERGEVGE
jgi:hypothetical protein